MYKVLSIDNLYMLVGHINLTRIKFTIIDDKGNNIHYDKIYDKAKVNQIIYWFSNFPNRLYYGESNEIFEVK